MGAHYELIGLGAKSNLLPIGREALSFCMFLSKMIFYNLVHTTIASFTPLLTEGRSVQDQSKQPPAKKKDERLSLKALVFMQNDVKLFPILVY